MAAIPSKVITPLHVYISKIASYNGDDSRYNWLLDLLIEFFMANKHVVLSELVKF